MKRRTRPVLLMLIYFAVPLGYFLNLSSFAEFEPRSLVLLSMNLIFFAGVISVCRRQIVLFWPAYLIMAILVLGYFAQLYQVAFDPETMIPSPYAVDVSAESIFETYKTITYASVVVSVVMVIFLRHDEPYAVSKAISSFPKLSSSLLLILTVALMILTFAILSITGHGIMGAEGVRLPFKISGITLYTRTIVIPTCLLFIVWLSDQTGRRNTMIVAIALLCLHAISDTFLRASRGALMYEFVNLTFLFAVSNRITRKRSLFLWGMVVLTVLMWPVITAYRWVRIEGASIDQGLILFQKVYGDYGNAINIDVLSSTVANVVSRITGGMVLLAAVSHGLALGTGSGMSLEEVWEVGPTNYFTHNVLGYPDTSFTTASPSLVGWFYLVGGDVAVIIGIGLLTSGVFVLWRWMSKLKIVSLPVAQVLFLDEILQVFTGGALEGVFGRVVAKVIALCLCEAAVRFMPDRRTFMLGSFSNTNCASHK